MTASRALSGRANVRLETRGRVIRAAEELGYRPNLAARALRTRRHDVVGFHCPELSMPLHLEVVLGARDALTRAGYRVVLDTEGPGDAWSPAAALDGSLLMPFEGRHAGGRESVAETCVCIMGRPAGFDDVDVVTWDQERVVAQALRHLAASGYRRVTWLGYHTGDPRTLPGMDLAETGFELAPDSLSIQFASNDPAEVDALVRSLISGPERPHALLVVSVIGTRLVLAALRRSGVRPGRDLGFVGTEIRAQDWGQLLTPAMTAIIPPGFDMGVGAARRLVLRMDGDTTPPQRVVAPAEFVVRGSTPQR